MRYDLLFLFLTALITSSAAEPFLTGRVLDAGNTALEGAIVHHLTLDVQDTTDSNGEYSIDLAPVVAVMPFSASVIHTYPEQDFYINDYCGKNLPSITVPVPASRLSASLRELPQGIYLVRTLNRVFKVYNGPEQSYAARDMNGWTGQSTDSHAKAVSAKQGFKAQAEDSLFASFLGKTPVTVPVDSGQTEMDDIILQGTSSIWNSYTKYDFKFNNRNAYVVVPDAIAQGRPWIWRARFWGHEPQTDIALLNLGYHLVYSDVGAFFGAPVAVNQWDGFYHVLTAYHGFNAKPLWKV